MTYGAFTPRDFDEQPVRVRPRNAVPQAILCAVGLVASASVGLWMLYAEPSATLAVPQASVQMTSVPVPLTSVPMAASRTALRSSPRLASHLSAISPATTKPNPHLTWFDPSLTTATLTETFAQTLPLGADFQQLRAPAAVETAALPQDKDTDRDENADTATETATSDPAVPPLPAVVAEIVRDIPLPLPRPTFALTDGQAPQPVDSHRKTALLAPQAIAPTSGAITNPGNFFQRVFGSTAPRGPALAYAAPDDDGLGPALLGRAAGPDRWTAVYNIATHTVTLPSGAQLEAHSGLGARLDDPRSITEHMRGATPPNVYDLTLREAPFHGVRALRLTPTAGTTYGRAGLLAHTFMLGPRGDSNGCVVFRNYAAFLQAYESGAVRRLAVVTGAV